MSGPSATNSTADVINGIISALMSGGEVAAEAYITALDPVLFTPPIMQWLLDRGVQYLGQILSIAGQKFADQVVFSIQTQGEQADVITATTALAIAQASNDTAAIAGAVSAASAAYKAAFRLDGWATPK